MLDQLAADAVLSGDDSRIVAILEDVCALTGMGFVAVARVTDQRWIACQVIDKIEFGMSPGDELEIKKTICDEVRADGRFVIVDNIGADPEWRSHPVPILYGFESYVSLPVLLTDGSFFGTLCAIDPAPRVLSTADTVQALQDCARRVAAILSAPAVEV